MEKQPKSTLPQETNTPTPPSSSAKLATPADTEGRQSGISVIRILAIIAMISSVVLFALPFINAGLIKKYSQINLNSISAETMAENLVRPGPEVKDEIEEIGVFNIWPWLNNYDEDNIIGQLTIPDLHVNLAIFKDTTNANLLAGTCQLKQKQKMGEGNFTLSGHRAKGKGVLLHNLMEADIGARINLTDKKNIYVYRIVDTVQTKTDAVDMLEDQQTSKFHDRPIISIMTCYFGKSSSRWFVIGELVTVLPYSVAEQTNGKLP